MYNFLPSLRVLFRSCLIALLWLAAGMAGAASPGDPQVVRLSEHLFAYPDPINVGIVCNGGKALLIDCGDGSVAGKLADLAVKSVDQILFTHHHRDQACGAFALAAAGAKIVVPAGERDSFDKVADFWNDPKNRWRTYRKLPDYLLLTEPLPVDATINDGETIAWGPATIRALATPGHTDGSLSYLVEVDGQKVVFCGDAIYDEGQIWELYSLQKGPQTSDYHGFLGARAQLKESLGRIKAAQPKTLVPSHGRIMTDPAKAIDALVARLDQCYDKYVAISALRHYFPKVFTEYAERKDHMPIGPGEPVPDCLLHFGTTWVLVSRDKAALAMDCGNAKVVAKLQEWIASGELRTIEGLWVTHYHLDHVDGIPDFQKAFDCPCITDRSVAEVIGNPSAWRLPCLSPIVARVDRATKDGESWTWHEFRLTAYHFPGQTLYHSGLFVEGKDLRMLFVGDSFTMAGIDDYCAQNRNWLGRDVGFDRCIGLIEKLRPTHIFNCHVKDAFHFTPQQCRTMRDNLAERERLYGQLFPWDHPNFGMDDSWVRCHPYEQEAAAGSTAAFDVVVTNHSVGNNPATCRAVLPRSWAAGASDAAPQASSVVAAKQEGRLPLKLVIPAGTAPGRYVIPVDVEFGSRRLPQFSEVVVVVC